MKEMTMEVSGEFYGECGKKAPFKDSNGEELYTGDVVKVRSCSGIGFGMSSIVEKRGEIFVMGIYGSYPMHREGEEEWRIYKIKSYKDVNPGEEVEDVDYKIKETESREEKIKAKREELVEFLKKEKLTARDWDFIKNYIDQQYYNSTLL